MNENKTEGSFMEEHAVGGTQLAHDAEKSQPHAMRKAGIWAQPSIDCSDPGCRVIEVTVCGQGCRIEARRNQERSCRPQHLYTVALQHEDTE